MAIPQFDFTDKPTNQLNTAQTTFDFSDPEPAQAQNTMADFRQMDAESMNQPGVARAEAIQNMPDFIKPAFMGLGRLESKIVDPVLNNPWVSRASQTGGEIMTMVDNPDKADTGSGFGNISADLVGGIAGFVANPESAGQKIWNFGEKTLGRALADTVPQAPGMVKAGIKAAGATIPFEATRMIVNDREANPGEIGIAIGANAVLSALIHGLLKPEDVKFSPEGIPIKVNWMGAEVPIIDAQKKMTYPWAREPQGNYINVEAMAKAQGEKAQAYMDSMNNQSVFNTETPQQNYEYLWSNLKTPVKNDFTADQFGNVRSGEKLPELPAGPAEQKADWFADQYGNIRNTPETPLALTAGKGEAFIKNADDTFVPRSDIGDPQYLASLEQRYNQMVNDEVKNLKDNSKLGVEQPGLGFSDEGEVVNRWGRMSNNPEWYRKIFAENATETSPLGKEPRSGQYRDQALKNLIEGNAETGEPASDEFHAILSELARGQKLPEEWHGLQSSIRTAEGNPELQRLVSDMKAAQKQVEPYGLNKNLDRLTELENQARQRMKDRADFRRQYPDAIGIKAQNPLDELKDLSIIGASKIAKGVTDFAQWSKEMLAEFGEIIRAKLNDIWQASREVLTNERGSIRFGGAQDTASHVVSKTDREPVNWAGAGEKAYRTVIDDLNRIGKFDDRLDEVHFQATGKHLDPEDKAYLSAINSKEAGGTTKTIVTSNLVDRNGNAIGNSLQSITEQIPKGQYRQVNDYLVLKNAGSWMAKGKQVYPRSMPEFYEPTQKIASNLARMEAISKSTAYTDQQKAVIIDALQKENDSFMAGINRLLDQRISAYEQANPLYKKISDELYAFDKAFKEEWLVNSGIITKEAWEAMQAEHPNYVKFQRKLDKAETGGAYQKGAGGQPVKRAKGSERPIINPIESMVEDIDRIVNIVRKQEVRQLMYENMAKYPEEMQGFGRIAYEGEIPRAARKAPEEGELRDIIDSKIDELGFDPKHGNTVPVQINGKTEHIVFYDPALLDALQALDPKASGIVINAAREVSRTMKVLTTGANPIFSSRNFARDLPMAYIFSDTLAKTPIKREIQFAWGIVDSIARVVTGGRYDPGGFYKTYKALGGGSHTSSVASDRNILAETMGAILPNEEKSVLSKVKGVGRGIESFTNAVETIPRLPEYVRTVQQMGDTAGARKLGLNRAQDLVNFSRKGSMSGEADAVVPYLNASLQAIDKIVRTFKKDPLETTERAFIAITIPAVMLWMINKDNPDYQQLSSWTKDNYYCIPTNDGKFIKIAKPREVGVLFASLPERCLDTWANDDPEGFRNFAAAWEANFIPANRPIWAPFTDIASNKSFSGTPIIPGYQERLSPELQYDESTSIPAKAIGGALGVSPKKIDYLTRSYTGVVGQLGLPATAGNGGLGESLSRNLLSDSLYSTDILTDFYNDKTKLDTASADYDATGKPGKNYDPEKLKIYNRAARDISALKEQMRTINASDIDPDQKEFALRGLQEKILNIARQVKSGTYGNGSANWITQWQTRL